MKGTGFFKTHIRLIKLAVTSLISAYMIYAFIFSDLGLLRYITIKKEYNSLRSRISQLKEKNKKMEEEIKALKIDPEYIESLAREKLGLVREGEIIYRFKDKE